MCLRENVTVRVPSLTVGVQWEVLRPIEDATPNPDCKGGDVLTIWLRHATSSVRHKIPTSLEQAGRTEPDQGVRRGRGRPPHLMINL